MKELQVLNDGFVKLLNLSGPTRRPDREFDADAIDPANTARISFNKRDEERTREQDLKLLNYLMTHRHTSPLEMIESWWHMRLPIFVARHLVRHRTATINEQSGRYTNLGTEYYLPKVICNKPEIVKQGRGSEHPRSAYWLSEMDRYLAQGVELYQKMLEDNVAPEQARGVTSVSHYTEWVFKLDMNNMRHLLQLRLASDTKDETRAYAGAVFHILKHYIPELVEDLT